MILIWKPRCLNAWQIPNTSFYRSKFRTINLMTNCWVGGYILTWWQSLSSYLNKTSLLTSEFEQIISWKFWEIVSAFQRNKNRRIWTFKTRDMGWTLNNVCAAGQILTSPLLLPFELENDTFKSWTLHKSFRPMS